MIRTFFAPQRAQRQGRRPANGLARRSVGLRRFTAVLLLACAAPVLADWRDEYRRGREAFDNSQWSVVVEAMRAAIAERSEERSGSGFLGRRYTPRFYLGVALAELGDCRQAIELFEESIRLGQVQETVDSRAVVIRKEACEDEIEAALERALDEARQAIREAEQARQSLVGLPEELGAQWASGDPSLEVLQSRADDALRRARQQLEQAESQGTSDGLDRVAELANQATQGFRGVVTEASNRSVAIAQRAIADARAGLTESVAGAERSLRGVRDLAPYPSQLGQRVQALQDAVEQAQAGSAEATLPEAGALRQAIDDAQDALAQAARRPPRRLLDAAQRYLSGDWTGTLEALEGIRSRERRARNQICILRAAAAWSLLETSLPSADSDPAEAIEPEAPQPAAVAPAEDAAAESEGEAEPPPPTPEELLASAIEGCRALDPQPVPEASFFSPRFLAFFEQALSAPAEDELEEGDPEAAVAVSGDGQTASGQE